MATSTDAAGDVAPRTLVVWVPDWPIVALSRDGDDPPPQGAPIAIFAKGAVVACSAAARAEGAASPGGGAPHAPRLPAPVDEARASLGGPCRTPPRTPHASSPSSQPLAGIPADRV